MSAGLRRPPDRILIIFHSSQILGRDLCVFWRVIFLKVVYSCDTKSFSVSAINYAHALAAGPSCQKQVSWEVRKLFLKVLNK